MKAVIKFPIHVYRLCVSPVIGSHCRYHPTCSAYALEALDRHGAIKGLFLTLARLLRCHPWSRRAGTDPVPERFDCFSPFRYKRGN